MSIILKRLYMIARFLKATLDNLQIFYEGRIAPFMAVYGICMFWPVYKLLALNKICFVANMGNVTGHSIIELDNFFRKLYLNQIDSNKRYVLLRRSTPITKACVEAYEHKLWIAIANDFIYNIFLPIIIRFKDMTVDCGLSKLKFQLPNNLKYHKTKYGEGYVYLYQLSKSDLNKQYVEYYKSRTMSKECFPLLDTAYKNPDKSLIDFLNGNAEKLALIHIKTERINATAEPTDPLSYRKMLEYLSDLGYRLVFVGREKMPEEFLKYKIINYANSGIATFRHDIQIFKLAELAVTAGSGISCLADCFNKPYLYLNTWHIPFLEFSEKCVIIPSLIQKSTGKFLKFSEQIDLYYSLIESNKIKPEIFSGGEYNGRNAAEDEILEGIQELIRLKNNFSEKTLLQERFRNLTSDAPFFWALSRVSEYFLNKHDDLF